jgi:hypothetical protein
MILFVVNVNRLNSPFWWLEAYHSADGNIYPASAANLCTCEFPIRRFCRTRNEVQVQSRRFELKVRNNLADPFLFDGAPKSAGSLCRSAKLTSANDDSLIYVLLLL